MPHVVKYRDSERGWGGEVWFTTYPTKEAAETAVIEIDQRYGGKTIVPDYYMVAEYMGDIAEVPKGYKC